MIKQKMTRLLIGALILAFLLTSCGGSDSQTTIRIGSKEFTEQLVLGNIYEILLNENGYRADYKNLAGTIEAHEALVNGEIDLYPEYTGTALLTQLAASYDPGMSGEQVYDTVKQRYEEQWDLTWLSPTSFNNTWCLTMTREKAQELGVQNLSQLSTMADQLTFGTTAEFHEREDGMLGLKKLYGGFNFKEIVTLDTGLKYAGLREGEIDVTTCFGTDGEISAFDLIVLEDDLGFWPPYPAAPVVRAEVLEANPDLADLLNQVSAHLDGETMSHLNWEVTGNQKEPDEVARDFLVENGLID